MAFGRKYLVDPATGLDIEIRDTQSVTGKPELHTAATVTVTANWNQDIVRLCDYMSVGRHAKVFVFDENGNSLGRETIYLFAHDYSPGTIDDITFTGYYPDVRLQWQIVPYNLPGEPPYLVYPEDGEGNIQPLRAGDIIQAILTKIKSKGAYANLQLQLHGELPYVVLEHQAGARFDEYLNNMVSTKSITYYTEETLEGGYILHVFPWFEAGVDRTAEVEFNLGSAQEIFQTEVNSQNVISKYTVVGKNGDIWEGENTAISALLGEPRADGVQRNNLFTKDMVDSWGAATLEQLSSFAPGYTFNGVDTMLIPGCHVLGRDYNIGDMVTVCVDGRTRLPLRVESATVAVVDSGTRQVVSDLRIGRSPREIRPKQGVVDPYSNDSTDPIPTDTTGNNGPLPTESNPGGEIPGDGGNGGGPGGGTGNTTTNGNPGSVVAIESVDEDGNVKLGQTTLLSVPGGVESNGDFRTNQGIILGPGDAPTISGGVDSQGKQFLRLFTTQAIAGEVAPRTAYPEFGAPEGVYPSGGFYDDTGSGPVIKWGADHLGGGQYGFHAFDDIYIPFGNSEFLSLKYAARMLSWPLVRFIGGGGDGGTPGGDGRSYRMTPTKVRPDQPNQLLVEIVSGPAIREGTMTNLLLDGAYVGPLLVSDSGWQGGSATYGLSAEAFTEGTHTLAGNMIYDNDLTPEEQTAFSFELTFEVISLANDPDTRVQDDPAAFPENGGVQPQSVEFDRPTVYRITALGHEGEEVNLLIGGVFYPDVSGVVDQTGHVYLTTTLPSGNVTPVTFGLRTPTGDVGGSGPEWQVTAS